MCFGFTKYYRTSMNGDSKDFVEEMKKRKQKKISKMAG